MIPVIALVGRPNVGKSTLFNRLTRTRDALVADYPGLTRDRKYGKASYQGMEFMAIDTGGVHGAEEGIDAAMAAQSYRAVEEADAVLFLVDARAGLTAADLYVADRLRQSRKPVFVVANKTDGIDADSHKADFYQLGLGEVWAIAAAHNRGIRQLIEAVLAPFGIRPADADDDDDDGEWLAQEAQAADADGAEAETDLADDDDEQGDESIPEIGTSEAEDGVVPAETIKIALIGRPNVGKSTLTNRMLGEERVVVYDQPGTTRDSIYIPLERDGQPYIIIDTAGVRRRGRVSETVEKFSIVKTLQAIDDANVVILLADAHEGLSEQDLHLLGTVLEAGRALVIAINKWDGLHQDRKQEIRDELERRLGFVNFAKIHFISALHGSGVGHLFESVQEAFAAATRRVSTPRLTRLMQQAVEEHNPPMVRGRRPKLRYAHAGGYNPPLIVIHGNQVAQLPDAYKRYLMNFFRSALKVVGTPIRMEFRDGSNPFAGKRNQLTESQIRKRQRMMRFHKRGSR
ncbi:MAG: ribosome biogenesis GTPase Der [Corallincola sp.]|nr:ribosome biogenesis GTPase Der [Corallincola sp.]